jgi:hypothetical protein
MDVPNLSLPNLSGLRLNLFSCAFRFEFRVFRTWRTLPAELWVSRFSLELWVSLISRLISPPDIPHLLRGRRPLTGNACEGRPLVGMSHVSIDSRYM